jgi:hypothetical protein
MYYHRSLDLATTPIQIHCHKCRQLACQEGAGVKICFIEFDRLDLQNQILRRKSWSHLHHQDSIFCCPTISSRFICMVNWLRRVRCMSYKLIGGCTVMRDDCTLMADDWT